MVRFAWILLIPLGAVVFSNLGVAGFVGDDYDQVLFNPVIRSLDNPAKFFTGSTFNSGGAEEMRGTYYKPVMTAVFALVYRAFGGSAFHFHAVQVALCILNSILLYFFFKVFFRPAVGWLGAALFLVHPAHSEVVQYISDYQDVLFMTFGLLALNVEVYRTSSASRWTVLEGLLLLASALSKETGLLFILLLPAAGWCARDGGQFTLRLKPAARSAALAGMAYVFLRIWVSKVHSVQAHYTPMETADTATRLLNIPAVIFYYIRNFFFPWPLGLAQHWIYRELTWTGFAIPLLAILAAVAFMSWSVRRHGKVAGFFALWCVLGLGLHSQVVPLDATVADRWHYLPSIGFTGMILVWVNDGWPGQRGWILPLSVVWLMGCGMWTVRRNAHWESEEILLTRDLNFQPDSFALMSQLGYLLLNQRRFDEACPLLERSVKIAPKWWVNTNNYGVCLYNVGRADEAMVQIRRSMDNGQYHLAFENYAKVLVQQNRLVEARRFLTEAVGKFPGNSVLRELADSVRVMP